MGSSRVSEIKSDVELFERQQKEPRCSRSPVGTDCVQPASPGRKFSHACLHFHSFPLVSFSL